MPSGLQPGRCTASLPGRFSRHGSFLPLLIRHCRKKNQQIIFFARQDLFDIR
ncbi:hypothetical protein HMPREF9538_01831 [Klebsiella sp. MS 92-3]|nr:hypothetical protein HMPREF9538_01831 [Klebsiella sp. MS 92-3]